MTTTIEQTPVSIHSPEGAKVVSWGAIFSGVFIAAALYLVLLILGTGLGFSAVSPWNFQDYAAGTIGWVAVFWIILAQIISSGGGGYIAGRLAPPVSGELQSRNQQVQGTRFYHAAHGLVVWALSSIAIAFLLGAAASNIVSGGASVAAAVGKGVGVGTASLGTGVGAAYLGSKLGSKFSLSDLNGNQESEAYKKSDDILDYALDFLIRSQAKSEAESESQDSSAGSTQIINEQRKEIGRILISSIQRNEMSAADKNYVAQLISERTGVSQTEARHRIDEALQQIHSALNKAEYQTKEALDKAREAAAVAALLSFVTLLLGAIIAAIAACYGGSWSQRHQ